MARYVTVPGFHSWFDGNRSKISIKYFVMNARVPHNIIKSFSTNALKVKSRV